MKRKGGRECTDNVLADLGFDDAEELTAKATLAVKFNELLEQRGLNQTEAAAITGMTQPKVSQVRRYKLQNISLERLLQALVSLDQRVEITVRPARRAQGAGITVVSELRGPKHLPVFAGQGGLVAGVDPLCNKSMLAALDDDA